LFIDKGPIVQVKEKGRSAHILEDRYAGAEWEGALVIMVNEFSASASEIMAAAMQDYDRAIIIGSRSTHGKGTVQRFLPLNRTLRNKNIPDIGSIKLTIQKFYRINGDATQLKGVQSDVIIPDNYMYLETGEQEHDYPLPWDQIKGSSFEKNSHSISDKIIKKSQSRINKNATFNLIEENAKRWEKQRENSTYALNFSAYTNAKLKEKEEGEKFEKIGKEKIENFNVSNPGVDIEVIEAEESRKKRNSDWVNSVSKNPYIYEALQIIEDLN
jgi:carboxyl-terminal processing protease